MSFEVHLDWPITPNVNSFFIPHMNTLVLEIGKKLERKVENHDKEIRSIFEAIRQLMPPLLEKPKKKIGFHADLGEGRNGGMKSGVAPPIKNKPSRAKTDEKRRGKRYVSPELS